MSCPLLQFSWHYPYPVPTSARTRGCGKERSGTSVFEGSASVCRTSDDCCGVFGGGASSVVPDSQAQQVLRWSFVIRRT